MAINISRLPQTVGNPTYQDSFFCITATIATKTAAFYLWLMMISLLLLMAPTVNAANKKPVAKIVKILPVNEQSVVTLDGSSSSDKGGHIVSYLWSSLDPTINLTGAFSEKASFTAPLVKKIKKYSFTLIVTDNEQASSSKAKITITVKPVNTPPIADAGNDQSLTTAKNVILDGSASNDNADSDGSIVSYAWKQIEGPKVKLSDSKAVQPTFLSPLTLPNNALAATLKFSLIVKDDENRKSLPDVVTVTIQSEEQAALSFHSKDFTDGEIFTPGTEKLLSWIVKNTGNIDLNDVTLISGKPSGELTINTISPTKLSSWRVGEINTFAVSISATNDIGPGTHSQSWSFTYEGYKPLAFSDLTFSFTTLTNIALALESKNFIDGDILKPDTPKVLSWTVKNNSNTDLKNVTLTPIPSDTGLSVSAISPANLANWAKGQSNTFSVTVTAPTSAAAGSYSKNWTLTHDNNIALPLNDIAFNLKVEAKPSVNIESQNFTDSEVLARDTPKILTWNLQNNGNTDLKNVFITPDTDTGLLSITNISPEYIESWSQNETKTFTLTVTAPLIVAAGNHSASWKVSFENGTPVPLTDGQTLGFNLTTDILSSCTTTYTFQDWYFVQAGSTGITLINGINDAGDKVGYWSEGNLGGGFYNDISLDGPADNPQETFYLGLNATGQAIGRDIDGYFVRNGTSGTNTYINAPASVNNPTVTSLGAINDNGVVVGNYVDDNSNFYGFLFNSQTSIFTSLPAHPDAAADSTTYTGINDNGWLVGNINIINSDLANHGFVYDGTNWTTITHPNADAFFGTQVTGINNTGEIVGYYQGIDGGQHGFIYDGINKTFLNSLLDAPNGLGYTQINGINNLGQIVGSYNGGVGFVASPIPCP